MSEKIEKQEKHDYNTRKEIKPTKESFEKVREILNKPRPYRSSDSKKQGFFPDLSLAAPLAVGAAMKVAPMIQYVLMNAHQM